jgi:hypothetical protein
MSVLNKTPLFAMKSHADAGPKAPFGTKGTLRATLAQSLGGPLRGNVDPSGNISHAEAVLKRQKGLRFVMSIGAKSLSPQQI